MLTGCREYGSRLIELARGAVAGDERRALLAHVENCAECARMLDGQVALSAALEDMAGEVFPEAGAIEARVLAEFDRAAKRPVIRVSRWALVAGLAAAMLAGVVWFERPRTIPARLPVPAAAAAQTPAPAHVPVDAPREVAKTGPPVQRVSHRGPRPRPSEEQTFLTIPYTVPLAPQERTSVVRMGIPVSALIAAGFHVPAIDAGSVLEADVLVSEDGRARAIRPIAMTAPR